MINHNPIGSKTKVVAAIPCFNVASSIADVITKTREFVDEVIVVDDGSTDHTAEVAKNAGAKVIIHNRNMGKGAAMKTAAMAADGDIIVFLDGDGQHCPEDITRVIEPIIKNGFDAAIGSRHLRESNNLYPLLRRRLTNILASLIISVVTNVFLPLISLLKLRIHIESIRAGIKNLYAPNSKPKSKRLITDCTSGLRAIRSSCWQKLGLISNGYQIETEMLYEIRKNKVILTEVPINCKWNGNYSGLSITRDGYKTLRLLAKKLANDFRNM